MVVIDRKQGVRGVFELFLESLAQLPAILLGLLLLDRSPVLFGAVYAVAFSIAGVICFGSQLVPALIVRLHLAREALPAHHLVVVNAIPT